MLLLFGPLPLLLGLRAAGAWTALLMMNVPLD
jgi:hypothetical protein